MYTYLYPAKIVINLVRRYDQPNIWWRRLFRRHTMSYQIVCSFGRKRRFNLCRIRHLKFTSIPILRLIAKLGERWTYDANGSETPACVAYALFSRVQTVMACDWRLHTEGHWRYKSESAPANSAWSGLWFRKSILSKVRIKFIKRKNIVTSEREARMSPH